MGEHLRCWSVIWEGRSIRSVARELGVSRNAVARYLRLSEPVRRESVPRPRPVMEKVAPRIDEILSEWARRVTPKQRPTGSRLHRQLVEERYQVGITPVRDYLREKQRQAAEVYVPLIHRPGEEGQFDFFEVTVAEEGKSEGVEACSPASLLGTRLPVVVRVMQSTGLSRRSCAGSGARSSVCSPRLKTTAEPGGPAIHQKRSTPALSRLDTAGFPVWDGPVQQSYETLRALYVLVGAVMRNLRRLLINTATQAATRRWKGSHPSVFRRSFPQLSRAHPGPCQGPLAERRTGSVRSESMLGASLLLPSADVERKRTPAEDSIAKGLGILARLPLLIAALKKDLHPDVKGSAVVVRP